MTIYIDADYKCHIADGGKMVAVETDAFEGKCTEYIEGYRFVPSGSTWEREDGAVFRGEMLSPWKPWKELDEAQREYEREQYAALTAENAELLEAMAAMVDDVYNQDVGEVEE